MSSTQNLETITIFHQLKAKGVEEDVALMAQKTAVTIFNRRSVRKRYIFSDLAQNYHYQHPSDMIRLQADVDDSIRVLEDCGFVRFVNGKYELTEKGQASFAYK